ncbi:DUF6538 domain-containing protein [Mesorhizobium sp. KR2-14]|uniref:DUF6538 domain-containing protein n=1 Tax=Mesorhizobium sp. KR2-14 TaxID=3156610 RepID=UPI0032B3DFE3
MSRADRRFLEKMNGGRWRVVVSVPRDLQKLVGKTKLKEPLDTDSLVVANQLKYAVVARLKATIDRHRAGTGSDDLAREALALREALARTERASEPSGYTDYDALADTIAIRAEEIAGAPQGEEAGQPVFDPDREARAIQFADIAFGRATPLDAPMDTFLAETKRWNARTRADFERAFGYLRTWMLSKSYPCTVEAVTRRVAGEFVSSRLVEHGMAGATINKYLSGLSGYWKWLVKKGYVSSNVWEGQRAEKRRYDHEELGMREFTSDELDKLFMGQPKRSFVYDAMAIAALTGARLGVVVSLKVRDCQEGNFHFARAKHEKHSRLVPIHPDLKGLIAARTRGKRPDEDLFPELPPLGPNDDPRRERGQPLTKSFGTYRQSRGVEDLRPDGRSRVNFHSFRRWFISSASRALNEGATGYSPWTIAEVVAHSKDDMPLDMTMAHYKAPDDMKARRACVMAVQLPPKARKALLMRYPAPLESSRVADEELLTRA